MPIVSNIQHFSIHDGPGIRTTVFLQGCNLRCRWCHNPETWKPTVSMQYFSARCTGCGACVAVCPTGANRLEDGKAVMDWGKCTHCMACVEHCPAEARKFEGRDMTIEEIVEVVARDKAYYDRSGGGVTLSGGEPLLNKEMVCQLLTAIRAKGIHTAVETALHVPQSTVEAVRPLVDYFMCDIKAADSDLHKQLVGAENDRVLQNIRYLAESGVPMKLRMPMVPTLNDGEENIRQTAEFLHSLSRIPEFELLKFHNLATGKYDSLGRPYPVGEIIPPDNAQMERYAEAFRRYGIEATYQK